MKRYGLSFILAIIAIVPIAWHYTFVAGAGLPEYKLIALEGDGEAGKEIELIGAYIGGVGSRALSVNSGGSEYGVERSFYENYVKDKRYLTTWHEDMRQLKKEHRNFMRDKSNVDGFYKDGEWLIYANVVLNRIDDFRTETILKLELLEESTGKISRFSTKLQDDTDNYWIGVDDVQRVGDEIHIVTRQNAHGQERNTGDTIQIYAVDMKSGDVIRGNALDHGIEAASDETLTISVISNEIRSQPCEYAVLYVRKDKVTEQTNETHRSETISVHLMAYSYRTGKLTPIPGLENSKSSGNPEQYRLNGSILIRYADDGNSIAISRYDVIAGRQEPHVITVSAKQLGGESIGTVTVRQDRAYALVASKDQGPIAAVFEVTSGKVLYRGQASYAGPASKADEYMKNLKLLNINVKP